MKQTLDVRGFLSLYSLSRDGSKTLLHADRNIITSVGRTRVAELLAGLSTSFVNQMALGDGGAPQSDLLTPIVPVLSDTALTHELTPTRTTTVNPLVSVQTLKFTSTFLTASLTDPDFISPANKVVNESGLFAQDGILFARKTFPSIPFAPADRVGVIAEWEIEVL